ncbi:MAG: hypothetical protein RMK65_06850 [Anaerolineae bacterium]|nr:hypothetical protein [Anaerolineae bacterium]MDW7991841.1 hypothetical protein [Anaerolineae bacterium]
MKNRTIKWAYVIIPLLVSLVAFNPIRAQKFQEGSPVAPAGVTGPSAILYQGYVTVGGTAYNGTGYFKFAIVNAAGDVTYWSNDGTSSGGAQPTSYVALSVNQGYFTVLLGDTSLSGMTHPLSPAVFAGSGRYLRVWFATSFTGPFTQLSLVPIAAAPYALNAETLDGVDSDAFARSDHNHWGASWSGTGVGLSLSSTDGSAIYAASSDAGGVEAFSNSSRAAAVYGVNTNSGSGGYFISNLGYGIYGTSSNLDGVRGVSTGSIIADNGVYGETNSIYMWEAGVYGFSSDAAAGVIGHSVSGFGVYGQTNSPDSYGGHFVNAAGPGTNGVGVRGLSASGNDGDIHPGGAFYRAGGEFAGPNGVIGAASSDFNDGRGVIGIAQSKFGIGVYAIATATDLDAMNYGVYGEARGAYTMTVGVMGYTGSGQDWLTAGIYGRSDSNSGAGVLAHNYWSGAGLRAHSWSGNLIEGWSGDPPGGERRFYVDNSGNLYTSGSKSGYVVDIVRNADQVALERGDVVVVVGVSEPIFGEIPTMEVRRATDAFSTAVVGVVDQVFVRNSEPEVMAPDCLERLERLKRNETSTPISPSQEHSSQVLPPVSTSLPSPNICRVREGLVAARSIQPGQYLSIVTLGAYKAIKVDASYGAIQPGDLLVASPNPGYAMKATNPQPGTIIGKALAPWVSGTGTIPVFVTLH